MEAPRMKKMVVTLALTLAAGQVLAATVPELFQKAKAEFAAGKFPAALETLDALKAESDKPENERYRAQLAPALAFYRGATLASLGKADAARTEFETYIELQPGATVDSKTYSKQVVSAFDQAKKSREKTAAGDSGLSAAYARYRPAQTPVAPDEKWVDGPVRYILSARERSAYGALSEPAARSTFVEGFWKARDPKPETPENEFRSEFERRVAFADEQFSQDGKPGSQTDRGMVFVLLGPPTYGGKKPLTGEDASQASVGGEGLLSNRLSGGGTSFGGGTSLDGAQNWREIWHFRREQLPPGVRYQQVDFEFVTKKGYGKNVLQRDPAATDTLDTAKKADESR
jgi:GWxTD domain-containing protein